MSTDIKASGSEAQRDTGRVRHAVVGGVVALAIGAWATALSWSVSTSTWWQQFPPRLVGGFVIVSGVVTWVRRPSPRPGQFMVLGGAVYYLQDLRAVDGPLFAVGFCLAYEWMAIAAHVLLGWPDGRLRNRVDRAYVITAHIVCIGTQTVRYLVDRPQPPWAIHIPQHTTFLGAFGSACGLVMGIWAIGIVLNRWRRSSPARRMPSGRVWLGIATVASIKIAEAAVTVLPGPAQLKITLAALFTSAVIVLVPTLYLAHRLHLRLARLRVVNLVVDLDRDSFGDPDSVEEALRRTVGDPTLRVCYPLADGSFADVRGEPVGDPSEGRAQTQVAVRGETIALIDHDAVLSAQRAVTDAAIAAAGFAIDNARLHATLLAQVAQIRTSRLRLAQTAFDERQRIQQDLHDGAQQRFYGVLMLLDSARRALSDPDGARAAIDRAHEELSATLRALRDLVQGIYPTVLLDHGLAAAVDNLIDNAPVPVSADIVDRRWTKHLEITSYFVISEALTNVYRHSGASGAFVRVDSVDGELVVEVTDDGRGGAALGSGLGLAGLRHRVNAVGGTLLIDGGPGHGTTIIARFPDERERGERP